MVGQETLLAQINSFDIKSFPRTSILIGDYGCGKHTLMNYISDRLHLETVDITDKLSNEYLEELMVRPVQSLYYIETSKISIQNQNVILKFIEEPTENIWVMLLCDDKSKLLDTVKNRCVSFEFRPYPRELLKLFCTEEVNEDLLFKVCTTPGQVKSIMTTDLDSLYSLCDKISTKINKAPYYNVLSIVDKINLSDEYDKYDFIIFFKMLSFVSYDNYVKSNNNFSYSVYNIVREYATKIERDNRLNKQSLLESMLSKLWRLSSD